MEQWKPGFAASGSTCGQHAAHRNRLAVAFDWLWAYVTFQSGARLITEVEMDDPEPKADRAGVPHGRLSRSNIG
jgi:hypothetical protein